MIKAAKKLKKLWAKKKRSRKKSNIHEPYYHHYPPPPSTCHCCCSYPSTTVPQPSAPPLPLWLEPELTISASGRVDPLSELAHPSQTLPSHQEIVVETSPIYPALPVSTLSSYQQYTFPNPVYGVPVGQAPRKERSGGFFGCFVKFGVNLIRCFCPCFRIQEASAPVVA